MTRLEELADTIIAAHQDVVASEKRAENRRMDAGKALIEAKQTLNHGEWIVWLRHIGLPQSTAKDYMSCARSGPIVLPKISISPKEGGSFGDLAVGDRPKRRSPINSGPRQDHKERIAVVRAAIVAAPEKSNTQLKREIGSNSDVIKRERANLVKEGVIKFDPALAGRLEPLVLPDKRMLQAVQMFEAFVAYLNDVCNKMPPAIDALFLSPETDLEKANRDGFLVAIGKIEARMATLKERYGYTPAKPANLRIVG